MIYMTTPQHKNPYPGCHEIYNFGKPFLGHHSYILSLTDQCLGVEEKILKEIQQFYIFYPKITFPWQGVMKFLFSLPYRCYIPNLVRILEKRINGERRTTHDGRRKTDSDGRQSIGIGHLSDSGDVKSSLGLSAQMTQKLGLN